MIQKANIQDIFEEIDKKANIADVNQLLTQTHQEMDQKASFEDLTSYINDQALIIEALCAETTVARWL